MKYDQNALPLGSRERAIAQLEKNDLSKALRTCKEGDIKLLELRTEIDSCLKRLYVQGAIGTILSGYYEAGTIGTYSINELLLLTFNANDFPGFLKQAYRFGLTEGLETKIEDAIKWHENKKRNDSIAWRIKFKKLFEQVELKSNPVKSNVEVIDEEKSLTIKSAVPLLLKPLKPKNSSKIMQADVDESDPYIISQISRRKLARANQLHEETLVTLTSELKKRGHDVKQTKLIDAYAEVKEKIFVFEVKSITDSNEREQVRHAISQLYEYRYLYSLKAAILFAVFSHRPSSDWLIEYLVNDREINVLWVENNVLTGISFQKLNL